MRNTLAVLALGVCLLTAACGQDADPAAAPPAAIPPSDSAPASPSQPAPTGTPAASKSAAAPATTSPKRSATASPSKRKSSPKPTATDARSDANAACDATFKSDDRLTAVKEANGPLKVNKGSSEAEIAAAVKALRAGYQADIQAVTGARRLTTDADVRDALSALIASRKAVVGLLDSAGSDLTKKNAALNTVAEVNATGGLWRYPEGVCFEFVD
ncbi:hypothetical protein ACFQFC_24750 [Amorphoplanes digitatis]|uniref:Lipoprotein n=1 Tax=Actinoplanes digitatis TaxID=1868 RepID=A0A7W7I6R2_9ACTN|nr:hypothetical protein [Actinoplanes digitatis]MBB4767430.1 hypothetical protein [Actinoplanes digitatis]GID97855.1 hypothetical protein Adi01nite_72670 [Actinoplanes digitatis]